MANAAFLLLHLEQDKLFHLNSAEYKKIPFFAWMDMGYEQILKKSSIWESSCVLQTINL